jgi:hypothetical protein
VRDLVDDHLKKSLKVRFVSVWLDSGETVDSTDVKNWEFQILFFSAKVDEKVDRLVVGFEGAGALSVNLVYADADLKAVIQSLLKNESGLRHGAFVGVYDKQNAIDHRKNSFDFAAKVSVARGINDVDFGALVGAAGNLGKNGNASFSFLVVAVHDTFLDMFVASKKTSLPKDGVN